MRVRLSLPTEDVEFLEAHISRRGGGSRSTVLQEALDLLRDAQLQDDYTSAWTEQVGVGSGVHEGLP